MIAKLAANFPDQSFLSYASAIITKPVAILLTLSLGITALLISAYVVRDIASTAKEYLFDQTPVEVVGLTFLLVVIYSVSSSRIGLFRLNMLFFPFIFIITIIIMLLNIKWFDFADLLPLFKTPFNGYVKGTTSMLTSYVGLSILFFYIALAERPKRAPKMVSIGVCITAFFYILVFITCIGVFGHAGTANLLNPTVELAKQVEIPGGVFERVEIVFYVIWMMAIFNTTTMALDVAVLALHTIFKKTNKMTIIFILSPMVYLISMLPQNFAQLNEFGTFVSYVSAASTLLVTILLLVIAKIRGSETNWLKNGFFCCYIVC